MVRRIEIAVFVAKPGPVASDFEAISSPWERQFSSSSLQPAGGVRGSIPDIPVAGQQALQFIREAGYLTGDLPDLLGQNLRVSWLIKRYTLGRVTSSSILTIIIAVNKSYNNEHP